MNTGKSFFTEKFFNPVLINEEEMQLQFRETPSRENTLFAAFLSSKEGDHRRKIAQELINKLDTWCHKNNLVDPITKEAIGLLNEKFHFKFTGTKILDDETYALCTDGLFYLNGIVQQIYSESVPLDHRLEQIKNLYKNLNKNMCGSGVHTHLETCNNQLKRDVANMLMEMRRELATNVILNLIATYNKTEAHSFLVMQGEEIHVANAVLNYYCNFIGINKIKDPRIPASTRPEIEKLIAHFPLKYVPLLSLDFVIGHILNQANPSTILKQINELDKIEQNTALLAKEKKELQDIAIKELQKAILNLEDVLKNCGEKTFKFVDLLDQDALCEDQYQFVIEIENETNRKIPINLNAYIYTLIMLALEKQGFLDLNMKTKYLSEMHNKDLKLRKLCFLPGQSLKFAYIIIADQKLPFISYLVNRCKERDLGLLQSIVEQKEETLEPQGSFQKKVSVSLCKYFQSSNKTQCLNLIKDQPYLIEFLKKSPILELINLAITFEDENEKKFFLKLFNIEYNLLLNTIDSAATLGKVFRLIDLVDWDDAVKMIRTHNLIDRFLKTDGLSTALDELPQNLRTIFLEKLCKQLTWQGCDALIQAPKNLATIMCLLPKDANLPVLMCQYLQNNTSSILNLHLFLQHLSVKATYTFFKNVNMSTIQSILQEFMLYVELIKPSGVGLQTLDPDKIAILLENVDTEYFKKIFNSLNFFAILNYLNQSGINILFNKIGSSHLQKLVKNDSYNFGMFLSSFIHLNYEQQKERYLAIIKAFLVTLTPSYLRRISTANSIIIGYLSVLPTEVCALLLTQLGKNYLQMCFNNEDSWNLILCPQEKIPPNYAEKIFKLFEIIDVGMHKLVPNIEALIKVLNSWNKLSETNENSQLLANLKLEQRHWQQCIPCLKNLVTLLECTPPKDRKNTLDVLITSLGDEYIKKIFFESKDMREIYNLFPEADAAKVKLLLDEIMTQKADTSKTKRSDDNEDLRLFKRRKTEVSAGKQEVTDGKEEEPMVVENERLRLQKN